MAVTVTVHPTQEPLSLSDLKDRLQVDHDDDDAVLSSLLTAARQKVESWEWRTHLTKTLTLTLDRFPRGGVIYLPFPPVQSVTSVTYVTSAGVSTVIDAADYAVDLASEPGRIRAVYGDVWPVSRTFPGAVQVVYVAGYADPSDVPQSSLVAIAELVRRSYGPTADCEGTRAMPANAPDWIDVFLNKSHDHRVLEFV